MDDLIGEFLTETNESLGLLDIELVKLEKNPEDQQILGLIFRVMHTIKGTCGFLGLPRLEHVAHASENVMGKIRDGAMTATPEVISLVLTSIDRIKELIQKLEELGKEPEGDDTEIINLLNACAESCGGSLSGSAPPPPTPVEAMPMDDVETDAGGNVSLEELERIFQNTPVDAAIAANVIVPVKPTPKKAQQDAVAEGLKAVEQHGEGGNVSGQSIRVNIDVLENLMQMVSELVLTRNQLIQIARNRNDPEFITPMQRLSHITTDLQEGVMKTRMQPIGNAWAKFPRLIRDLALELKKKIELKMLGAETELDRQMLEMIKDPLTHMVRNSADHGLEGPDERRAAGKNEVGTVTLSAYHEGGHILIKIIDDGRGINIERVKQKALANGIATQSEIDQMSEQQICQFIFKAGFSTAEKVTSVSGRGVGMDVVITNIQKIGGSVELFSVQGKGSTFVIKLPLTLAIMPALVVECSKQRFAIPQIGVSEIVSIFTEEPKDYVIEEINGSKVLRLREHLLPLFSLQQLLQLPEQSAQAEELFVVVCHVASYEFGLIVDRVFDTEEIVVKPVAPVLKAIEVYSGATILGDGSVIMILDPNGIVKTAGMANPNGTKDDAANEKKGFIEDQLVTFLVFKAGGKTTKCVPLELVSRLEEIKADTIEWSGHSQVVQYRGDLMHLITLDSNYTIPETGIVQVVVFSDEGRILGVVVEEILDIAEAYMEVKGTNVNTGSLGSLIINEKSTDLLDIGHFFAQHFKDWHKAEAEKESDQSATHVLLIDDSPFFRKFMKPILTAAKYRVTTAESAIQAVEWIEGGFTCNAIITDIDMPEMDGIEFLQKFRSMGKQTPVVALSSFSNDEILMKTDDVKFDGYVSKANRDALVATLGKILQAETV
jgi:two-component system chemotaxis sensor kinase CheA